MTGSVPAIQGFAAVCVDSADPVTLAAFWQALVGGEIEREADDDGEVVSLVADGWAFDFLRVEDARRGKNRLHVDVRSTDFEAAIEGALRLGATRADDVYDGSRWQVLRDPEGNEFCILRPGGDGFG